MSGYQKALPDVKTDTKKIMYRMKNYKIEIFTVQMLIFMIGYTLTIGDVANMNIAEFLGYHDLMFFHNSVMHLIFSGLNKRCLYRSDIFLYILRHISCNINGNATRRIEWFQHIYSGIIKEAWSNQNMRGSVCDHLYIPNKNRNKFIRHESFFEANIWFDKIMYFKQSRSNHEHNIKNADWVVTCNIPKFQKYKLNPAMNKILSQYRISASSVPYKDLVKLNEVCGIAHKQYLADECNNEFRPHLSQNTWDVFMTAISSLPRISFVDDRKKK